MGGPQSLGPPLSAEGVGDGCQQQWLLVSRCPCVSASSAAPAWLSMGKTCLVGLSPCALCDWEGRVQGPVQPLVWMQGARQHMAELGETSGGVCCKPLCRARPGTGSLARQDGASVLWGAMQGCPGDRCSSLLHAHTGAQCKTKSLHMEV